MAEGIEVRHRIGCASETGGRCRCKPSYRAWVWSAKDGKLIRKGFPTKAAAQAWRTDALGSVRKGTLRVAGQETVREASQAWLAGAEEGSILSRSGEPFRPSTLKGYRELLDLRILPALGAHRLFDLRLPDLQRFVRSLMADGLKPSTVRNTIMPLRVIYRHAVEHGEAAYNPTNGLRMPALRSKRERIASPDEADRLLKALPARDRPLWATAFYGGLRRGELAALRFEDIDLAAGVLRVERSHDYRTKSYGPPKSRAGTRKVPIPVVLRDYLDHHKLSSRWLEGLAFGTSPDTPFNYTGVRDRALKAWKAASLEPIGLHEARHTFASLMIAAEVPAKALSTYMGHANIAITYDVYGHLMPGNERESAALLDAYLERANTAARLAQLDE